MGLLIDREKVVKGLECLISNEVPCEGCPYYGSGYCLMNIAKDAMDLLKEQDKEIKNLRTWKAVERGEVIRTYEDRNEAKLE